MAHMLDNTRADKVHFTPDEVREMNAALTRTQRKERSRLVCLPRLKSVSEFFKCQDEPELRGARYVEVSG
jgi:hypothetical protein